MPSASATSSTPEIGFRITKENIAEQNQKYAKDLKKDYDALGDQLARRGFQIDRVTERVQAFTTALPSWGLGTGGTRFGRFPNNSEPRNVYEKMQDAATVQTLTQCTPRVSLHIPWDRPEDPKVLVRYAKELGVTFDAMNSNTFQDQKDGQPYSYKYGSLTHTDRAVRQQAIEHNVECIEIGKALGSKAITVWIADGGNYPGQIHFRRALGRYQESCAEIYKRLPPDWRMFLEHKMYEPAFYSTVNNDWGTSYAVATALGKQAYCLVDLGHHAPNANIEMIVSRFIHLQKLGGFHFNDSKYGDDDLTAGSIKPYQLFLIFNELVDAEQDPRVKDFKPAYMVDQSCNLKDPIEDLIQTSDEILRVYAKAWLVRRKDLENHQEANAVIDAELVLQEAFNTDVTPIIKMARQRSGGAIEALRCFRESGYRKQKEKERPQVKHGGAGIV